MAAIGNQLVQTYLVPRPMMIDNSVVQRWWGSSGAGRGGGTSSPGLLLAFESFICQRANLFTAQQRPVAFNLMCINALCALLLSQCVFI